MCYGGWAYGGVAGFVSYMRKFLFNDRLTQNTNARKYNFFSIKPSRIYCRKKSCAHYYDLRERHAVAARRRRHCGRINNFAAKIDCCPWTMGDVVVVRVCVCLALEHVIYLMDIEIDNNNIQQYSYVYVYKIN